MLKLYFVYNGHRKFFLGVFDNVDDLIEQMKSIRKLIHRLQSQNSENISEKMMYVLIMARQIVIT